MDADPSSTGRQGRELSCEGTVERPRVSGRASDSMVDSAGAPADGALEDRGSSGGWEIAGKSSVYASCRSC